MDKFYRPVEQTTVRMNQQYLVEGPQFDDDRCGKIGKCIKIFSEHLPPIAGLHNWNIGKDRCIDPTRSEVQSTTLNFTILI